MERILPYSQLIELCQALETVCEIALDTDPQKHKGAAAVSEVASTPPICTNAPQHLKPTIASIPRNQLNALDSPSVIDWIQRRLNVLGYNHLPGDPFFPINKRASARSLGQVAASMYAAALPIKCLEAVVLSMWLISEVLPAGISAVPIAFKSVINLLEGCGPSGAAAPRRHYRHIVLAVVHYHASSGGNWNSGDGGSGAEVWGALGLSRRKDLMNKPLHFKSLADLVEEYLLAYSNNGHEVVKVKVGMPAPKNMSISTSPIQWKLIRTPIFCNLLDRPQLHELTQTLWTKPLDDGSAPDTRELLARSAACGDGVTLKHGHASIPTSSALEMRTRTRAVW